MLAASIWSLIIPAIEMCSKNLGWLVVSLGILAGVAFLVFADYYSKKTNKIYQTKSGKLSFAITLHNIPEGMAVRSSICFYFEWKFWYGIYVCNGTFNRNCNSKYSRGYGNFSSIQI